MSETDERKAKRARAARESYLAVLALPLAVAAACLAADLSAGDISANVGRTRVIYLFGGVLQLLVIGAVVPWWGARLCRESAFGALVAAARAAAMVVSTTLMLLVLGLLQRRAEIGALLMMQSVVLGWAVFAAGLGALFGALFRAKGAAAVAMFFCLVCVTSPFWGNLLIGGLGEACRSYTCAIVVNATPIAACADAVGYDLWRDGRRMLYDTSIVADTMYSLPRWWVYALIALVLGMVTAQLATWRRRSTTTPSGLLL